MNIAEILSKIIWKFQDDYGRNPDKVILPNNLFVDLERFTMQHYGFSSEDKCDYKFMGVPIINNYLNKKAPYFITLTLEAKNQPFYCLKLVFQIDEEETIKLFKKEIGRYKDDCIKPRNETFDLSVKQHFYEKILNAIMETPELLVDKLNEEK